MEKQQWKQRKKCCRTEIEFWRYMIESRRGTISEQATERMLNACELAERKLMMMDSASDEIETRQ